MKIGVFDSGIGGLNVLKVLQEKYPNNEYIYLADMKNCPFGGKSKEQIIKIAENILNYFKSADVHICVCACGTISAIGEDLLKKFQLETGIHTFGMIDGVKEKLIELNSRKALLLATEATINCGVFENKIKEENDIKIIPIACREFVDMLENYEQDEDYKQKIVDKYIPNNIDIDSIILGCTHYVLLKKYILNCFQKREKEVYIIEPGESLINRKDYSNIMKNDLMGEQIIKIYTTKETIVLCKTANDFFGVNPELIEM